MKLTKSKLKQIIKEEIHTLIESPDINNIMTKYLQGDTYKDWDESEKWQYAEFLVPLKNLIEYWGNENVIIKSILDHWKRVIKHDYDYEEDKFTDYGMSPEDAAQDWLDHIVPLTPGQPKGEDNAFAQATWGGDELGPAGMANEWKKIEAKYKALWAKIQPHVHYAVDFWKSPHKVSQEDFWNAVHKRLHLEEQKQKLKQIIKEELPKTMLTLEMFDTGSAGDNVGGTSLAQKISRCKEAGGEWISEDPTGRYGHCSKPISEAPLNEPQPINQEIDQMQELMAIIWLKSEEVATDRVVEFYKNLSEEAKPSLIKNLEMYDEKYGDKRPEFLSYLEAIRGTKDLKEGNNMKLTKSKLKQIIKEELENLDTKATDKIPTHPGNVAKDAKSLSQALLGYYGGRGLQWAFSKDDFGAGDGDAETKNIAIKMHNFILSVIPERYNFNKRVKDFRDELKKQSAKNKYAAQAVIDLDAVIEAYERPMEAGLAEKKGK